MDDVKYRIELGSVEPKTFRKFENGRMVTYTFGIYRGFDGLETHRSEPVAISSVGWDNGNPFTANDYDRFKR